MRRNDRRFLAELAPGLLIVGKVLANGPLTVPPYTIEPYSEP